LIRQNRRALFHLLFEAANQTLLEFGRQRLKAQIGVTAVLHTCGQTLTDHYHLHCIVTGGGLALEGNRWAASPGHYLFPVRALSKMFCGRFCAGLQQLHQRHQLEFHGQLKPLVQARAFGQLLHQARRDKWVVYAQRPFAGPQQVLAYLSRYTHRVAIGNGRLLKVNEQAVTFRYKDYADQARHKTMTLPLPEFVRRFCLHVLPERFVKIRHYGLLTNRDRQQRLDAARQCLKVATQSRPLPAQTSAPPAERRLRCPFCGALALICVEQVRPDKFRPPLQPCDSS
jgi:Putative transposase